VRSGYYKSPARFIYHLPLGHNRNGRRPGDITPLARFLYCHTPGDNRLEGRRGERYIIPLARFIYMASLWSTTAKGRRVNKSSLSRFIDRFTLGDDSQEGEV